MVNFNGTILSSTTNSLSKNRAFLYGDGVFETLKIKDSRVLFLEDHYFRLMSSMRILRMEIPMDFTMEYLESQILDLVKINNCGDSARVRITVYRNDGGYYLPNSNKISYLIDAAVLENKIYNFTNEINEVEIYKDFYVSKQLISSLKSTNRIINITGSIFANENGYNNCLLMNENKNIIEALNGNLFMVSKNKLITPPISEGCLNGIMRKQILILAKKMTNIEVIETAISPFDLQKADELFITNVIKGIQPITKYRKKEFGNQLGKELLVSLNSLITQV